MTEKPELEVDIISPEEPSGYYTKEDGKYNEAIKKMRMEEEKELNKRDRY